MSTKSMDILFICPAGGDFYYTDFRYTLGSAYIIAYLRKNGFIAEQFISDKTFNVDECVMQILNYKPKIIGFTVYNSNYMQSVLLSRGIKRMSPKIITIFGGPTPTVQSKDIIECERSIDICVRGEGEEVTLKILNLLRENDFIFNKVNLEQIGGLSFRKNDKIIMNPESNILSSNKSIKYYIDKYPSPYLSKVISAAQAFPLGIITARGCNQNCVYCNCAVMSKRNLYLHSTNRVIEELSYIGENRSSKIPIPINDDGFTILPYRAKEICEKIIECSLDVPLACITRADKVNIELLDLMKQAGFQSIGFSLESAVPKVLRSIGKANPPDKKDDSNYKREKFFLQNLHEMTKYARKIKLHPVFISIMVGLPGETFKDAKNTMKLVKKLDIDYYVHNKFHIYKGTPIYQNYKDNNYKIKQIGDKNRIFISNDHPFNVNKIKYGSNCAERQNFKFTDYNTLKILANNSTISREGSSFKNLIIKSNRIEEDLVLWMQKNLALNGAIIQIYDNREDFKENNERNKGTLYDLIAPTKYHKSYYWENIKGKMVLKSEEMLNSREEIGLIIEFINAESSLHQYTIDQMDLENVISFEKSSQDIDSVFNFFDTISRRENPYDYLLESNTLPQFLNICKWANNQANCRTLETAIIEDNYIKICWYSGPIAEVGISYTEIKKILNGIHSETIKERNCQECSQSTFCNKCPFPYPLSSKKFCNLKNIYSLTSTANLVNSISVIKDLIFEPITLLDY